MTGGKATAMLDIPRNFLIKSFTHYLFVPRRVIR